MASWNACSHPDQNCHWFPIGRRCGPRARCGYSFSPWGDSTIFLEKNYIHTEHEGDRKSTRLNSSHTVISYAVFCLKKKKKFIDIMCIDINVCTSQLNFRGRSECNQFPISRIKTYSVITMCIDWLGYVLVFKTTAIH